MVIIEYFRALLFDWRKNRAIREAQRSADLYRKKFLVLVHNGRPVCVHTLASLERNHIVIIILSVNHIIDIKRK